MDPIYPFFARTDPQFYDRPDTGATRGTLLAPTTEKDWSEWARQSDPEWTHWAPPGAQLPEQGWKIHVSATPQNAQRILDETSRYCHVRSLPFKHVPSLVTHFARNAKEADRASSGKFITIYPLDEETLYETLDDLDGVIGGEPAPYVLSDLRWNEGPLYVRYGAFAYLTLTESEREVLAMRHPDGTLVEDRREPSFTPPPWVELPRFLREQLDRWGPSEPPPGFPRITAVRHYSNAGGVYAAEHPDTGERIILKEARPHAGLTPDGRDAVARSRHEEHVLHRLAGPGIVQTRGSYTTQGHRFLALEQIEGMVLNTAVGLRQPLVRHGSHPEHDADYRQWALGIAAQLDDIVARIHAEGWVHGDLHPGNVMVTPDDTVVLIDFEVAQPADGATPIIGAAGYIATDGRTGFAADRYALACIKLLLFAPLAPLLALDGRKAGDLLEEITRSFALDPAWVHAVRRDLGITAAPPTTAHARRVDTAVTAWAVGSEHGLTEVIDLVAANLQTIATHPRSERLWPGDPAQFTDHPAALAHGAGGVVHALRLSGLPVDPAIIDWMAATIPATLEARTGPLARRGLYDGAAGFAWLLRRLGRDDEADRLFRHVRTTDLRSLGTDLAGGLPGIGLALLSESERTPDTLDDARTIAHELSDRLATRGATIEATRPARTAGLFAGPSGTALFAIRLYEHTADPQHLALAARALELDLARCIPADDGSIQLDEGWRLMPYLGAGSAGVGLVLSQLLPHLDDPASHLPTLAGIRDAADTRFVIQSGMMQGRAGLMAYLFALEAAGHAGSLPLDFCPASLLPNHVERLRLHALRSPDGVGFPGQGLLRQSCDLSTGSAGVLAALATYRATRSGDRATGDTARRSLFPLLLPERTPGPSTQSPPSSAPTRREEVTS